MGCEFQTTIKNSPLAARTRQCNFHTSHKTLPGLRRAQRCVFCYFRALIRFRNTIWVKFSAKTWVESCRSTMPKCDMPARGGSRCCDFSLRAHKPWVGEGSSIGNEVQRDFLSQILWMELLEGWVVMGRNSSSNDYIIMALPIHDHTVNYRLCSIRGWPMNIWICEGFGLDFLSVSNCNKRCIE
jgi:hypothetical protein